MDESEVAVTRRYYRSGESEYYINRQSVRLKDMTELFMDTGMGREGYSIIGQGRIDEILSAKSTDRREIFEEAAGISKYRHRKEEAERKLERTEENLVRINDKIAELELQVEPLRMQAETGEKISGPPGRAAPVGDLPVAGKSGSTEGQRPEAGDRPAERGTGTGRGPVAAWTHCIAENEQFGQRMQEKDMEAEGLRTEAAQLDAPNSGAGFRRGGAGKHHQPSDGEYRASKKRTGGIREPHRGLCRSRRRSRTPKRQSWSSRPPR